LIVSLGSFLLRAQTLPTPGELQQHLESEISISDSLAELFVRFHSNGSIIIRGNCTDASFIQDAVPLGPNANFSGIEEALAAWSKLVPRLIVHRSSDSIWRVSDSSASPELLKTRINNLRARVIDADDAIGAVLGTKEVNSFFRDNAISQASTTGLLAPYDPSSLPHSAWHLHDVTVEDAFDAAIKKYPGVWVYTECIVDHRKLVNVRTRSF